LNSGSVVVDAAKKDCLDSVSCGYVSYGRSVPLLAKKNALMKNDNSKEKQLRKPIVGVVKNNWVIWQSSKMLYSSALMMQGKIRSHKHKRMIRNRKTVMDKEGEVSQQPRNLRVWVVVHAMVL
jgi:hypothetical protein